MEDLGSIALQSKSSVGETAENRFNTASTTHSAVSEFSIKTSKDSPNYLTLNPFMDQGATHLDAPLANGVIHRHTPTHGLLTPDGSNPKNSFYSTNQASPNSQHAFQPTQRSTPHSSFSGLGSTPARSDFEVTQQRQDGNFFTHSTMFDPTVASTSNTYGHSFGLFGTNTVNPLHSGSANITLMNNTLDIKPSLQSLQSHPFYPHTGLQTHDQNGSTQRNGMSPLQANPMSYRPYPQMNDIFTPRFDFYAQQPPFGHPQYWYMRQPTNQILSCLWVDQTPFPKNKPCGKQFTIMQDIVRHINDEHISRLDNSEYICYWQNCARNSLPFKAKYKLVSKNSE